MTATLANWQELLATLRRHRYRCTTEEVFQEDMSIVLSRVAGLAVQRERRMSGQDRVDFYLPDYGCAMELKVHGSPHGVLRQLHRYAGLALVDRVLLVTTHLRLGTLERYGTLQGKPLEVVALWQL